MRRGGDVSVACGTTVSTVTPGGSSKVCRQADQETAVQHWPSPVSPAKLGAVTEEGLMAQ